MSILKKKLDSQMRPMILIDNSSEHLLNIHLPYYKKFNIAKNGTNTYKLKFVLKSKMIKIN